MSNPLVTDGITPADTLIIKVDKIKFTLDRVAIETELADFIGQYEVLEFSYNGRTVRYRKF